jgi:hypothetical protein
MNNFVFQIGERFDVFRADNVCIDSARICTNFVECTFTIRIISCCMMQCFQYILEEVMRALYNMLSSSYSCIK